MTRDLYPNQLALLIHILRSLLPLLTLSNFQCSPAITYLAYLALWNLTSYFLLVSALLVRTNKVENLPALMLPTK